MAVDKETLKRQRAGLLADITHLQVDTILADTIQGVAMSDERHALIELAQTYHAKLERLAVPEAAAPPQAATATASEETGKMLLKGNRAAFEWLAEVSRGALAQAKLSGDDAQEDRGILRRMVDQCVKLEGMLSRAGDENDFSAAGLATKKPPLLELSPQERIELRKAWELGTHTVVMQTCIAMDGDVVNRVARGYADQKYLELHKLHNQAVQTSVNTWQFIVKGVVTFLKDVLSLWGK